MGDSSNIDFYESYARFKDYAAPNPSAKESARYDEELWQPAGCAKDMSFLEIGCGRGHFLAYLREKGVTEFLGIDQDSALVKHVPDVLADHFRVADVWEFLENDSGARRFDRVVMLDRPRALHGRGRRAASPGTGAHSAAGRTDLGAGAQHEFALGRPISVR